VFPKWAWSGSREQFLHCGLRKFCHSKSSVYRWYTQLDRRRFVYDTYKTTKETRTRHGWVHMFNTHRPTLTHQLYNFDLFRTCRTSSFCTVAWQLARFQLTRRIARSVGDSWASCNSRPVSASPYNAIKPSLKPTAPTLVRYYKLHSRKSRGTLFMRSSNLRRLSSLISDLARSFFPPFSYFVARSVAVTFCHQSFLVARDAAIITRISSGRSTRVGWWRR